jgi:uncharacterized membrane protein YqiK
MDFLRVICRSLVLVGVMAPSVGLAADSATLTVATTEARLYAKQDTESKVVVTLPKGAVLKPLAQGVGTGVWYMVKTPRGRVGWIQGEDVASTQRTDEVFRDHSKVNAKDVTPEAQAEANKQNDRREAEVRAKAEARAEAARQRAAELQRATIRAQAELERQRIRARGEAEAAEKRQPDTCLNCVFLR